jgi:hypothetical protein
MSLVHYEDGRPLAAMVAAGHPKTDDERLVLAAYFRGDFKKRPGRAPDEAVLRAARLYPTIKRDLQKYEQATGTRLRPRREAAIACTLAYLRDQGYPVPEREKLEHKLRRSKKPRKKP